MSSHLPDSPAVNGTVGRGRVATHANVLQLETAATTRQAVRRAVHRAKADTGTDLTFRRVAQQRILRLHAFACSRRLVQNMRHVVGFLASFAL